jgi:hypothetical protein
MKGGGSASILWSSYFSLDHDGGGRSAPILRSSYFSLDQDGGGVSAPILWSSYFSLDHDGRVGIHGETSTQEVQEDILQAAISPGMRKRKRGLQV